MNASMRIHVNKVNRFSIHSSVLAICFLAFLITACQTAKSGEELQSGPDSNPEESAQMPTATAQPIADSPESAADIPEDHCLNCHTDKDRLIDTAAPEEEVVEESSGEG